MKGDEICLNEWRIPVNRGTPALLAAAIMTGFLSLSPTYVVEMSKLVLLAGSHAKFPASTHSPSGNLTTDCPSRTIAQEYRPQDGLSPYVLF